MNQSVEDARDLSELTCATPRSPYLQQNSQYYVHFKKVAGLILKGENLERWFYLGIVQTETDSILCLLD